MRTMLTVLLLTVFAARCANAASCAPQIVFGPTHASAEAAALEALNALLREGKRYESGGFMVERSGEFRASKPVTQRSRSDVNYCIVLPRGASSPACITPM